MTALLAQINYIDYFKCKNNIINLILYFCFVNGATSLFKLFGFLISILLYFFLCRFYRFIWGYRLLIAVSNHYLMNF